MRQAPISLEALKLRIISSSSQPISDPLLTKDGVHYLIKALAYADAGFSAEIENVLVKAGTIALPELIKSLTTENLNVRSVAAMVLIRMGRSAEDALLKAYPQYSHNESTRWVFQFILQELGLDVPHTRPARDAAILPLEKVG